MNLQKKFYDDLIWSYKYRPNTMDDILLPEKLKTKFKEMTSSGKIPNLLLHGSAGTGKTTLSFIVSNCLDKDTMYINGSKETSIDVLRGKISQFVTTVSFNDGKKLVVVDECLEENEEILTGKLGEEQSKPLKDFLVGEKYDVISWNQETGELENDEAEIINEKYDEVYLVELEDGRTIKATKEHPFFVKRGGEVVETQLMDIKEGDEIVTI